MKYIADTVNVPDMTPISFPDDDICEDGVVVSVQPDLDNEFSVQIQIQLVYDNKAQSSSV